LPSLVQALALALPHSRLEAFLFAPLRGDLLFAPPEVDGQTGQVGRAERGRFGDHRAHDRDAPDVGLALAEEVVARRAAVDAQLFRLDAGIRLHAFDHVARLVGHRFDRGAGYVRPGRAARQSDDGAARVRVPVGRAEADERRDEIDSVIV